MMKLRIVVGPDLSVQVGFGTESKQFPHRPSRDQAFNDELETENRSQVFLREISAFLTGFGIPALRTEIFLGLPLRSLVKLDSYARIVCSEIVTSFCGFADSEIFDFTWTIEFSDESNFNSVCDLTSASPFDWSVAAERDKGLFASRLDLYLLKWARSIRKPENNVPVPRSARQPPPDSIADIPLMLRRRKISRNFTILLGGGLNFFDRLLILLLSCGRILPLPSRFLLKRSRCSSDTGELELRKAFQDEFKTHSLPEIELWLISNLRTFILGELSRPSRSESILLKILRPRSLEALPQNLEGLELMALGTTKGLNTSGFQHGATYGETIPTTWERYEISRPGHFRSWNRILSPKDPVPAMIITRRSRIIDRFWNSLKKEVKLDGLRVLHTAPEPSPLIWATPFMQTQALQNHSKLICTMLVSSPGLVVLHRTHPKEKSIALRSTCTNESFSYKRMADSSIFNQLAWSQVVVIERMHSTTLLECVCSGRLAIVFDPFSFTYARVDLQGMYTDLARLGLWVVSEQELQSTLESAKDPEWRINAIEAQKRIVAPCLLSGTPFPNDRYRSKFLTRIRISRNLTQTLIHSQRKK